MAEACYSLVLNHSPELVWSVIRDFGLYGWAGVDGETIVEDGKAGDQVGAVRRFTGPAGTLRQRLLAHSERECCFTYCFCEPAPFPVQDYVATLRVLPVTADGRSFLQWSANFDCDVEQRGRWREHFQAGFATWLAALDRYLAAHTVPE